MTRSVAIGFGYAFPDQVIPNSYFSEVLGLDTGDEWIFTRTGIKERRWLKPDEDPLDLAVKAGDMALADARLRIDDIDLLIAVSSVPYRPVAELSTALAAALGRKTDIAALDIAGACNGYIEAVQSCDRAIRLGEAKKVLIVSLEALSRSINMNDRSTCVLFGDGSGATVFEARENTSEGIMAVVNTTLPTQTNLAFIEGGGTRTPLRAAHFACSDKDVEKIPFIQVAGRQTFRVATKWMVEMAERVLKEAKLTSFDSINYIIPHQANLRIIEAIGKKMGIKDHKDRIVTLIEKVGNISSACIPVILGMLRHDPDIQERYPGFWQGKILCVALGGDVHTGAFIYNQAHNPKGGITWQDLQESGLRNSCSTFSLIS